MDEPRFIDDICNIITPFKTRVKLHAVLIDFISESKISQVELPRKS